MPAYAATDGKVRAYNLSSGSQKWIYDAKAAFFAPAALDGETVYAADLKGVVHAVNAKTGKERWKLDLATDPDVKAPGMAYAGPVVDGGKVYVATSNLGGEKGNDTTAVVCIGEK